MSQAHKSPRGTWRSKWRWVFVYWVVQAVVTHVVWATLMWDDQAVKATWPPVSWSDALRRIEDGGVLAASGIVVSMVTLLQAMLLMPVQRPGIKSNSLGIRLAHCGLCATTIAVTAWVLIWPVLGVLEELGLHLGSQPWINSPVSFAVPIAAWVVAFSFLWSRRNSGIPVLMSVSIAALGAALMLVALLGAIGSAIDLAAGRETGVGAGLMLGGGALGWIAFTPLLMAFCHKRRTESALSRIAARLFLGTIVEAAAIIPLDVMVRRKFDCYCEQGTFWALTICWGVGALALGPAVFLLPLSGRRKRWYAGLCDVCDYDMSGCMDAERCPECGAGWRERVKR